MYPCVHGWIFYKARDVIRLHRPIAKLPSFVSTWLSNLSYCFKHSWYSYSGTLHQHNVPWKQGDDVQGLENSTLHSKVHERVKSKCYHCTQDSENIDLRRRAQIQHYFSMGSRSLRHSGESGHQPPSIAGPSKLCFRSNTALQRRRRLHTT